MKHKIGFNRLGRKSSHRKALLRNMVSSLFVYERIKTTKSKANEVRKVAEKMITRAKIDSVHTRREIARKLYKKSIVSKLFTDIAPRFVSRPGGYTRVIKLGQRPGDASEMVFLELVDRKIKKKPVKDKKDSKAEVTDKKETKTEAKTTKKSSKPEVKDKKETKTEAKTEKKTTKTEAKTTKKQTKTEEVKSKDKDITLMNEQDTETSEKDDKSDEKDTTIIRE